MPLCFRRFALALPLLALGASGCGSSSGPAPDPASLVPAAAPLYASALVRPEGSLKSNALSDGRALTHEREPYAALLGALDLAGPRTAAHRTRAEVESWLGDRAGVFLTQLSVPAISGAGAILGVLRRAISGGLLPGAAPGATGAGAAPAKPTQGALIVDATNLTKARAFLRSQARATAARAARYRGVAYSVDASGQAFGLVGAFVVIGSESGLNEVIETSQGASALPDVATYRTLRGSAAAGEALANAYADAGALLHSLQLAGADSSRLRSLLRTLAPSGAFYISLTPRAHEIRLDIDTLPSGSAPTPSATESEQAAIAQETFQALPEDSWLALGVQDFGAFAEGALAALPSLTGAGAAPAGGAAPNPKQGLLSSLGGSLGSLGARALPGLERLLGTLEAKNTVVKREFLSWMGPAGAFVSGSNLGEFNAALVIIPRSTSMARASLSSLQTLLAGSGATVKSNALPGAEAAASVSVSGLPVPLEIAAGQGKFVIGLGVSPVQEALSPTGTLGASAAYQAAVSALGEGIQPRLMLNFPTFLTLANVLGLSSNAAFVQITPYLRSLTTLTAGTRQLGAITRTRLLLGLG